LRIEAYFQQVRQAIETCPVVQSFSITYDKRGTHEGFIWGRIYIIDGSTSICGNLWTSSSALSD